MVISSLSLADGIGGKVYKKVAAANFALYKEKKGQSNPALGGVI